MTSCGWLWLYAGAGLMLAELLAPGFVVFFFGLSAASVGLCRFAFGEALTPTWQLAAFSAFSVLYLLFLRRWLKRVFMGTVTTSATDFEDDMVGRLAKVTAAVEPPKTGRVMVDAILNGKLNVAAQNKIPVNVKARIPDGTPCTDVDLCVFRRPRVVPGRSRKGGRVYFSIAPEVFLCDCLYHVLFS